VKISFLTNLYANIQQRLQKTKKKVKYSFLSAVPIYP
jgi:hypothetical protein